MCWIGINDWFEESVGLREEAFLSTSRRRSFQYRRIFAKFRSVGEYLHFFGGVDNFFSLMAIALPWSLSHFIREV